MNATLDTGDTQVFFDLLPVGTVLCHSRIITMVNASFAQLFEYRPEQLIGKSLEILYPTREDFLNRGEQWRAFLALSGGHCDERMMMRRGAHPIRVRVRGKCSERDDPYRTVACAFELVDNQAASRHISPREREIVDGIAQGMTSKEMARAFNLSHRTVETYRQRLMTKVGARNATQLISLLR